MIRAYRRISKKHHRERIAVLFLTLVNTIPACVGLSTTLLDDLCQYNPYHTLIGGKLHQGQLAPLQHRWRADLVDIDGNIPRETNDDGLTDQQRKFYFCTL